LRPDDVGSEADRRRPTRAVQVDSDSTSKRRSTAFGTIGRLGLPSIVGSPRPLSARAGTSRIMWRRSPARSINSRGANMIETVASNWSNKRKGPSSSFSLSPGPAGPLPAHLRRPVTPGPDSAGQVSGRARLPPSASARPETLCAARSGRRSGRGPDADGGPGPGPGAPAPVRVRRGWWGQRASHWMMREQRSHAAAPHL
jgi:hypothetical protein